jgi:pilus assembly protein CpaB
LLLTPEQAERLTLASELGKVSLVLRSPDDNLKTDASLGTTASDLFGIGDEQNRKGEQNFLASNAKAGGGFLGMLGGGKSNPEPVDVAAATPNAIEVFTMELIEGPQARSIAFTRADSKAKWQASDFGGNRGAPANPAMGALPPANQDSPSGAVDLGGVLEPVLPVLPPEKD